MQTRTVVALAVLTAGVALGLVSYFFLAAPQFSQCEAFVEQCLGHEGLVDFSAGFWQRIRNANN